MLERIARLAIAAPRRAIAVAVLIMLGAGIFGVGVVESLSAGGLHDPTSESSEAARLLSEKFGQGDMQLTIAVTSDVGVQSPGSRAVATDIVERLQASPYVVGVHSAWAASPTAQALIGKDGKTGLIIAGITGGENDA